MYISYSARAEKAEVYLEMVSQKSKSSVDIGNLKHLFF